MNWSLRKRILACCAALSCFHMVYASDTISGSILGSRFPGNEASYGGGLTYQHASDTGGVLLGIGDTKFPVGSLAVVDVDAYRHQFEHFWFTAGASLGDAQADDHSSTLYKVRLAMDTRIDPQWSARLADQFIDLDMIHGHLMTAGAEYRVTPLWGLGVSGGYSLSGTLADRYGQVSVNWYGRQHTYGGIVLGRTGYDPANLGETAAIRRLFQVYAGTNIPVGHAIVTLAADTLNLEGATRQTLRIGIIEPINP